MYTQFPAVAIFFPQQENQYLYFLEFYTVQCLLGPGAWRENNTCIFYGCRAYLFPRLVRICNPELSNRGFVITFIPVPVEVSVFNIT